MVAQLLDQQHQLLVILSGESDETLAREELDTIAHNLLQGWRGEERAPENKFKRFLDYLCQPGTEHRFANPAHAEKGHHLRLILHNPLLKHRQFLCSSTKHLDIRSITPIVGNGEQR